MRESMEGWGPDMGAPPGYAAPPNAAMQIWSIICLLVAVIASVAVFGLAFWAAPSFKKMFDEMDVKLPVLTQIIVGYPCWLVVPLIVLASVIKEVLIPDKRLTLILNGFHFCLMAVIAMIYVIGLFLPLVSLMQSMGK